MKILNKKIKIGDYRGIEVYVDWKYLIRDMGLKKEEDIFQKVLGRFFYIASLLGLAILFLYEFTLGDFLLTDMALTDGITGVIGWALVGIFMYSFYLRRNRDKFFDTLDLKALTELRTNLDKGRVPKSVEVLDFADPDVLNMLDDLIRDHNENIYEKLMLMLVKLKDVQKLLDRL
ncbi:MAG: hypothetical protein US52_C0061G0003 [candidate division WS6 bacterium GW2011_GWA2_37_6]|uniref:Uncharacterized protein n=1 Tax=candidate division WS6 bacterium GW2011_GWA2_37_6 TaxID=1619087 RepID=A0A0G0JC59_9BACT|nr:MAG: hypothetical protein US52_C0061G0003 [candidate division WS6 bacterium GW2011_GWA2_37_6]